MVDRFNILRRLVLATVSTEILQNSQNFEKIVLREFLQLCEWSGGACGKRLQVCETFVHRLTGTQIATSRQHSSPL